MEQHTILFRKVAQFLHLPTQPTRSPLSVMVGNGAFLPCSSLCPNIILTLDSHDFSIDLYPPDLSGIDVVLGVCWLSMMSPFVMDYNGPFMRFTWHEKLVELKG
ncbi:hypothetical protein V8G54_000593, partial [Vigna mungo]